MSSPSENSPDQSVTVSSPVAADDTIEDRTSSTRRMGPPPGVSVQFITNTPNTTYDSRLHNVHARSTSPRPRRAISLIGLSIAQQPARTAEQWAESAISGVGVVADQTRRAQAIAEAAIAEARTVCEEVESKISEVAKRADVSASGMADNITGKMREVAAYTDAQTSRAIGDL